MPIPRYLQSSAEINKRKYELSIQRAKERHEWLMQNNEEYAREYNLNEEQKNTQQTLNEADEKDHRGIFSSIFDWKPLEAETNPLTSVNNQELMGIPRDQMKDVPYETLQPINNWKKEVLFADWSDRSKKFEELSKYGMADWNKGELKNVRYNYNRLMANGQYELASKYLDDVVNDKYKLITTDNMPQNVQNELIQKQKAVTGKDYDNVNVNPTSVKNVMRNMLPNYREFEGETNYRGEKYIDFSDQELMDIGSRWKDILRMYGETDAYNFLYNSVQQRIADNTHMGQRIVQQGYGAMTDAVSTVASLAGMIGKFYDFNVSNNRSFDPNATWTQNWLQGLIDNDLTRWAQTLMTYQTWNPDNVTDDMRQMGGRYAGTMRAPGEDVFSNPALFIPETVRLVGFTLGTMGTSALLSTSSKAVTKGLSKGFGAIMKSANSDITKARMAITKFDRAMQNTNNILNVMNAGVVSMNEGVVNSLSTYDQQLANGYMELARSMGLNPQVNNSPEAIANTLTLRQMERMSATGEDPQTVYDRLYQKNLESFSGYDAMIKSEARSAARLDLLANAAINGPFNIATQQFLFSPATRDALRGSRINRALSERTTARKKAHLDAVNSRRAAKGKEPLTKLDGEMNPYWAAVKGAIGEGFEEYLQELSTEAAQGASTQYVKEFIKGYTNEDAIQIFVDGVSDNLEPDIDEVSPYFRAIGNSLFSRQSLESLLLGAIGGTLVPSFNNTTRSMEDPNKQVWLHRGMREDGTKETRWQALGRAIPFSITPVANIKEARSYNKQLAEFEKEVKDRLVSFVGDNPDKLEDAKTAIQLINLSNKKQDATLSRDDFAYKNNKLEEAVELAILFRRRPNNTAAKMYYDALQKIVDTKADSEEAANFANMASENFAQGEMYYDEDGNLDTKAVFQQIQKNAQKLLEMRDRVAKEDKRLNRIYGQNLSVDARKALIFGTIFQDDLEQRKESLSKEVGDIIRQVWPNAEPSKIETVEDAMYSAGSISDDLINARNKENPHLVTPEMLASLTPKERSRFIQSMLKDLAKANENGTPTYLEVQVNEINSFFEQGRRLDPEFASKVRDLGRVEKAFEDVVKENSQIASNPKALASMTRYNAFRAKSRIYQKRIDKLANETTQEGFDNAMNDIRKDLSTADWKQLQDYILSTEVGKSELYKNWAKQNGYGKMIVAQDIFNFLEQKRLSALRSENADSQSINSTFVSLTNVIGGIMGNIDSIEKLHDELVKYKDSDPTCTDEMKRYINDLLRELPNIIAIKQNASGSNTNNKPKDNNLKPKGKSDKDKGDNAKSGNKGKKEKKKNGTGDPDNIFADKDDIVPSGKDEAPLDDEAPSDDHEASSDDDVDFLEVEKLNQADRKQKKKDQDADKANTPTTDMLAQMLEDIINIPDVTMEMSDDDCYAELDDAVGMNKIEKLTPRDLLRIINGEGLQDRFKIYLQSLLDRRTSLRPTKTQKDDKIDEAAVVDTNSESPGQMLPLNGSSDERILTSQKKTKYSFESHSDKERKDKGDIGTSDTIIDILERHGALGFVNSGKFADIIRANPDTPIYFLHYKNDTQQYPYLFLAIESEEGDIVMDGRTFQLVGCLGYSDEEGAGDVENRVRKNFMGLLTDNKEVISNHEFISTYAYTTKVKQLYTGKYIESEEPHDVTAEWLDGRPLALQFYYSPDEGMHPIVNMPESVPDNDIYQLFVEDSSDDRYNGSIWLYFKVADGRWFPSLVTLKMFDKTGYDLDANWNTPFVKELLEQAKTLFDDDKSLRERLQARSTIYNLLYFLDRDEETGEPNTPIRFDDRGVYIDYGSDDANVYIKSPKELIEYLHENVEIRISLHDYFFNTTADGKPQKPFQNMSYEDFILQSHLLSTTHTVAGNVNGGFTVYEGSEQEKPNTKPVTKPMPTHPTEQSQRHDSIKVTIDGVPRMYYREKMGDTYVVTDNERKKQEKKISSLISAIIDNLNIQNVYVKFPYSGRTYIAELSYDSENSVEVTWMGTENQYEEHQKESKMKKNATEAFFGEKPATPRGESTTQIVKERLFKTQDEFQDFEFAEDDTDEGITIKGKLKDSLKNDIDSTFVHCHRIILRNYPDSIVYVGNRVIDGKPETKHLTVIVCDRQGTMQGFESFHNKGGLESHKPQMYPKRAPAAQVGVKISDWLDSQGTPAEPTPPKRTEKPVEQPAPDPKNKTPRTRKTNEPKKESGEKKYIEPSADAIKMRPDYPGASEENWENPPDDGFYHDDPELVKIWNTYLKLTILHRPMFEIEHMGFKDGPLPLARATDNLWEAVLQALMDKYYMTNHDGSRSENLLFFERIEKLGLDRYNGKEALMQEEMNKWYEKNGFTFGPYEVNGKGWLPFKRECLRRVLSMPMEQGHKWVEQMSRATKTDALAIAENLINCH